MKVASQFSCYALLILGLVSHAYADEEMLLTSEEITKIKTVQNAQISPDGKWIAVRVSVPRVVGQGKDGASWTELHVINVANGSEKPFITGEVSIGSVQWSQDSKSLYYIAKRYGDSKTNLYRIPVDGGESVPVIRHSESVKAFDLSPDGKKVAFLAQQEKDKTLKKYDEQGFTQEVYEEDGRLTSVWLADLNQTTRQDFQCLDIPGSVYEVHWGPNGNQLAVVAAPTPTVDDRYMKRRIHLVDPESSEITSTLKTEGKLGMVQWSPTGEKLAVIAGQDIHDPAEGRITIHDVKGTESPSMLLEDYKGHVTGISWLDSETILWMSEEGVGSRMGTITSDGKIDDWLPPGDVVFNQFSIDASSENLTLVGNCFEHPDEVFHLKKSEDQVTQLTNHNPWLANRTFGKQVVVDWTARDGLALQGLLIYPVGYQAGERYPTIMYVHGGPESHEKNGWLTSYSRPGQVAAAKGFVVFYPNYRGSTGRGVGFSKAGQGDSAGKEFDDLIDGIDHLIEEGIADPKAIGVTGGSYGGYASAWCSTYYSDRFAASVMFVGISNKLSKAGTTDIPEEMYLVHQRKRPWEDWGYFLERSPIRYVERNRTPTLILHGKEDPRVHPSQSLELHRHLKTLGQAPVRLVLYPGEGHGNRRAASKFDYNLRMLRWMEHFLIHQEKVAPQFRVDYENNLQPSGDDNPSTNE